MSARAEREQLVRDELWLSRDPDTAIAEAFPDAPMPELAQLIKLARQLVEEEFAPNLPLDDKPDGSPSVALARLRAVAAELLALADDLESAS